jgi:hypothetical protein
MISITATVEFEIELEDTENFDAQSLLNELVKVKSGNYENLVVGTVTKIIEVTSVD